MLVYRIVWKNVNVLFRLWYYLTDFSSYKIGQPSVKRLERSLRQHIRDADPSVLIRRGFEVTRDCRQARRDNSLPNGQKR